MILALKSIVMCGEREEGDRKGEEGRRKGGGLLGKRGVNYMGFETILNDNYGIDAIQ